LVEKNVCGKAMLMALELLKEGCGDKGTVKTVGDMAVCARHGQDT